MRHALIINAHQKYPLIAEGHLTDNCIQTIQNFLQKNGFDVQQTNIELGYDIKEELEKFSWAYYFIIQYPIYWMGLPWIAKKYFDEVISAGQGSVTYENDGRSKKNPSKTYGSGGLMRGKRYMLSMTYNCPKSEFNNDAGFFGNLSVDDANVAVHKIFQFCGASKLQSYVLHDVYCGNLDMLEQKDKLTKILKQNFL